MIGKMQGTGFKSGPLHFTEESARRLIMREVNLELGMPTADQAVKRLTYEIYNSKRMKVKILKIIHGYGSSGIGGKIRIRSREYLKRMIVRGEIHGYIPGEEFTIFNEETRQAFIICPELRKDKDLERHNNGVTFIVL